jgi:CBS domain-containing protein
MKTAIQIIQNKMSPQLHTTTPEASVLQALQQMADENVGALLVVEGERLVGIFSERDYARKVILLGKTSANTKVAEIMTTQLIVVTSQTSGEVCMALMTEWHIRHLPVMEKERILGILSIGDLVKDRMAEQEYVIKQLEQYIYHS